MFSVFFEQELLFWFKSGRCAELERLQSCKPQAVESWTVLRFASRVTAGSRSELLPEPSSELEAQQTLFTAGSLLSRAASDMLEHRYSTTVAFPPTAPTCSRSFRCLWVSLELRDSYFTTKAKLILTSLFSSSLMCLSPQSYCRNVVVAVLLDEFIKCSPGKGRRGKIEGN